MATETSSSQEKPKQAARYFWNYSTEEVQTWAATHLVRLKIQGNSSAADNNNLTPEQLTELCTSLCQSVQAVQLVAEAHDDDDNIVVKEEEEEDPEHEQPEPPRKRQRKTHRVKHKLVDPQHVWVHVKRDTKEDTDGDHNDTDNESDDSDLDIPVTTGGKLAVLSVGGLLNGMAAVPGGFTKQVTPSPESLAKASDIHNIKPAQLLVIAHAWHRAIQLQVHRDILTSTPRRIHDMLCPDLTDAEVMAIRKRIHATVVLGKGLHTNSEWEDPTLATGTAGTAHAVETHKRCPVCGNNDQATFVVDRKNGDVICSNCGTVVSESLMHEGSQYRNFEGEVDRNHHGNTPNPLYSNAHNLSTGLSGVAPTTGAGMGGWRSGGSRSGTRNMETILKNAHAYTEMNVSQFGAATDRRTRVGYKDRQKKDAFVQLVHTGDALNLHEAVVQRAKELFAGFRDDRELVQQFKGVIAGCLCEAFAELSAAGEQILKAAQGGTTGEPIGDKAVSSEVTSTDAPTSATSTTAEATIFQYNKRAARRNELHHNNLAGKGGLLLDFSSVEAAQRGTNGTTPKGLKTTASSSSVGASSSNSPNAGSSDIYLSGMTKPAATWDLEDCRRWLTKVPRQIALEWVEAREQGVKDIPSGSVDELEGELVMHTLTLMEHLEQELQSKQEVNGKKVVTPRLTDLAKLGIQWQHKHERGAGSKSLPQAHKSKRTAGQILILKTAKKLGSILDDPVAGEAIHRKMVSSRIVWL